MRILAIETSCDDTGVALLDVSHTKNKFCIKVVKNLIASQKKEHSPFGGVVPNIARREHEKNLPLLFRKMQKERFDVLAVTVGPGLEPALWAGIEFAKKLAKELHIPLIGVNHLEGHLYSFLFSQKANSKSQFASWRINFKQRDALKTKIANYEFSIFQKTFPAIALIVSGGNTILVKMDSMTKWDVLGGTVDDAAGEALDKAARMLRLPYPGGPEIEKLARKGNPRAIKFPRPMLYQKNYDFSFAGLKTALSCFLLEPKKLAKTYGVRDGARISKVDIAASFQEAVVDVLARKTIRALQESKARSLFLSGGVAANSVLRKRLRDSARENNIGFYVASHKFNTDNAAMIAVAGYMNRFNKKKYSIKADAMLHL